MVLRILDEKCPLMDSASLRHCLPQGRRVQHLALLLCVDFFGCRSSRIIAPPPTPVSSIILQEKRSRIIQGSVISVQDSLSVIPGVELIFHRVGTDSLARSWRAVTREDGDFRMALPAGNRYRVDMSYENRHVATTAVVLPAVGVDSSAVEHNFYVPCRASGPIIDELPRLYFADGQASLSPSAVQTLGHVLRILQANSRLAMRLEGHTDAQEAHGKPDPGQYLQRLAQRRAQSAYNYLHQQGILANRLSVRSFGSQRPLVPDSVPEEQLFNRRVEFKVVVVEPLAAGSFPDKGLSPSPAAVPSRKPSLTPRVKAQKHSVRKSLPAKAPR
jgi:outer membrane protein OmpA-like peptidoglycan-associated protein